MKMDNSKEMYERAIKVIPGGTNTISKRYDRFVMDVCPAYIKTARDCYLFDIDNNLFIDWSAALGAISLGYLFFNPKSRLTVASLPGTIEVELAEKLIDLIPCAEMVRYFKNGSDATSAAVRISKSITKKDRIICCGYHGWHDWYAYTLPGTKWHGATFSNTYKLTKANVEGIIKEDFEEMEMFKTGDIAAIITEPFSRQWPELNWKKYLTVLRRICDEENIVLIFDEMIMGCRYAVAGGQEYFDVIPDMATYGKAVANGYPFAFLVGKKGLMEASEHLQISGTYFGDMIPMEICLKTLDYIIDKKVIIDLADKSVYMTGRLNQIMKDTKANDYVYLKTLDNGPWSSFSWEPATSMERHLWHQIVFQNGIFYNRDHFMMATHGLKEINKTLDVYEQAFSIVTEKRNNETLREALIGNGNGIPM